MRRKWLGRACALLLAVAAAASAEETEDAQQEFSKGLAALSRGDLDDAAKRFDTVIRLDPGSFEAHNNIAVIYAERGDIDNALAELERVLQLKPDYFRGRKNLAELYARLAHQSFIDAAAVAPESERESLQARARLIGGPAGSQTGGAVRGGVLEPATAGAPAAATPAQVAAPVKAEPAPEAPQAPAAPVKADVCPGALVGLANGIPAIVLSDRGIRLCRLLNGGLQPAERIPVKKAMALPATAALYVAVPGDGRVELVPLRKGQKTLTVTDTNNARGDVRVDAQAFAAMQQVLQAYLTPAIVAAEPSPGVAEIAQAKKEAMLTAFHAWEKSWQGKDLNGYLESYVADYNPRGGPGHQKWRDQRAQVFERSGDLSISVSEPVVLEEGETLITLSRQDYRSKLQSSTGVKKIIWAATPQGWKIIEEEMLSEKKG